MITYCVTRDDAFTITIHSKKNSYISTCGDLIIISRLLYMHCWVPVFIKYVYHLNLNDVIFVSVNWLKEEQDLSIFVHGIYVHALHA